MAAKELGGIVQLNFLQEDVVTTPQKSKNSPNTKSVSAPAASDDLFGGLPIVEPPVKSTKQELAKDSQKPQTEALKKTETAFKTISEAAAVLEVPQHVLRFWESRFTQLKPLKMGGGRRYYRPEDMDILSKIKHLLYKQGYTIKGAKKVFNLKETKPHQPEAVEIVNKTLTLTDKQKKQVSAIHQELLVLRETLRPYLAGKIPA